MCTAGVADYGCVESRARCGGGAISGNLGFGATLMMLGQSMGLVYLSGMAQSVTLGDSDMSVAMATRPTPQQHLPLQRRCHRCRFQAGVVSLWQTRRAMYDSDSMKHAGQGIC